MSSENTPKAGAESPEHVLRRMFPECRSAIQARFRCVNFFDAEHQREGNAQQRIPARCVRADAKMNWCIVKQYCPQQGEKLQACVSRFSESGAERIPSFDPVPIFCVWRWKAFERCLLRQQTAGGRMGPAPSPAAVTPSGSSDVQLSRKKQ